MLHLNNNNFKRLSVRPFISLHHLKSLRLEGNPWHCDCKLRDLWHWLQAKRLLLTFNSASCASPTTLKGKQHTSQFYSFGSTKMSRLSWNDFKIIIFHSNGFFTLDVPCRLLIKHLKKFFHGHFCQGQNLKFLGVLMFLMMACAAYKILCWGKTVFQSQHKYNSKYNKYWIIPLQEVAFVMTRI